MTRHPAFKKPAVLAHRMIAEGFPENTVLSLRAAIAAGVDWVEFDVKQLADGELISLHDGTVDRTTDGQGDVTKMTLKEVRALNAGKGYGFGFVNVPTVEEILAEMHSASRKIQAEMHIHNLYEPEPLVALLDKYHVKDRCYFNLNAVIVAIYMREDMHDTESRISLNVGTNTPDLKDICKQFDMDYLCISQGVVTKEFMTQIHAYRPEKPVYAHCMPVQTEEKWKSMIEMGVDVIQTDYPGALMEYLVDNPDLVKRTV